MKKFMNSAQTSNNSNNLKMPKQTINEKMAASTSKTTHESHTETTPLSTETPAIPDIPAELHHKIIKDCLNKPELLTNKTLSKKAPSHPLNSINVSDLLTFRQVSRSWAQNVDLYLRTLPSMTVAVVPGPREVADYFHHLELPPGGPKYLPERTLSVQEAVATEDIEATHSFKRITQLLDNFNQDRGTLSDYDPRTAPISTQLPDGPVFRMTTKQLPEFINLLKSCLKLPEDNEPKDQRKSPSLQLKTLSFAFHINHPHQLYTDLTSHWAHYFTVASKELPLFFDLLDLAPHLQHLWLTLNFYQPKPAFITRLIDYLLARYTAPGCTTKLSTLDLNFMDISMPYNDGDYSKLAPLMPHLTHFGLTDAINSEALVSLLCESSGKLASLKVNCSGRNCPVDGLSSKLRSSLFPNKFLCLQNLLCQPEIRSSLRSLVIIGPLEMRVLFLKTFTSLVSLKLVHADNKSDWPRRTSKLTDFSLKEASLIKKLPNLRNLTLVNFDLPSDWRSKQSKSKATTSQNSQLQLPQVTSLTMVPGTSKVFLEHFLVDLPEEDEDAQEEGEEDTEKDQYEGQNNTKTGNENSVDQNAAAIAVADENVNAEANEDSDGEDSESDDSEEDEEEEDVLRNAINYEHYSTKEVDVPALCNRLRQTFPGLKVLTLIGTVVRPAQVAQQLTRALISTSGNGNGNGNGNDDGNDQPEVPEKEEEEEKDGLERLQLQLADSNTAGSVPMRYGTVSRSHPRSAYRSLPMIRAPDQLRKDCTCQLQLPTDGGQRRRRCPLASADEDESEDVGESEEEDTNGGL